MTRNCGQCQTESNNGAALAPNESVCLVHTVGVSAYDARVAEVHDEDLVFSNERDASRYTLRRGDELLSVLDYNDNGATVSMTRAFTIPTHRGHGYAAVVVERAVAELAAVGNRTVLPVCWYVAEWFEQHQEYAGMLHRRAS